MSKTTTERERIRAIAREHTPKGTCPDCRGSKRIIPWTGGKGSPCGYCGGTGNDPEEAPDAG